MVKLYTTVPKEIAELVEKAVAGEARGPKGEPLTVSKYLYELILEDLHLLTRMHTAERRADVAEEAREILPRIRDTIEHKGVLRRLTGAVNPRSPEEGDEP